MRSGSSAPLASFWKTDGDPAVLEEVPRFTIPPSLCRKRSEFDNDKLLLLLLLSLLSLLPLPRLSGNGCGCGFEV